MRKVRRPYNFLIVNLGWVIKTLDDAGGELFFGGEVIEDELAMSP